MEFLTKSNLSEKIYDTIYNSEKYLFILSPFIQLDDYFKKEVFKTHLNNSSVHIIIGFGKNESNVHRSFKREDIEYFIQFPNITIVYIPNLHAKYYGNEKKSIITSMNLIDYSFVNNIEFGVYSEKNIISQISSNSFFNTTFNTCLNIVEDEGFTIFVKRPKYKKKIFYGKDYVGSEVQLNLVNELIKFGKVNKRNLSEFRNEKYVNIAPKEERKQREDIVQIEDEKKNLYNKGFCIRCKTIINLDVQKPLCWHCYNTWSQFEDPYYSENFCLVCGNEKNTNFARPICNNCYKNNKNVS